MKAVLYHKYGGPDVLQLQEIARPVPKPNEMLVRVHATSVTAGDWRMRKADPFLARIYNGLFKPTKVKILGFELSGVVEETGLQVKKFRKGDQVFAFCGIRFGGYAEYRCFTEKELVVAKPSNLTFEEAATVPLGALTALGFLQKGSIQSGQEVLVYGASGSVGTFAIQLARHIGARVTAVCSTRNLELVKSLGAQQAIDYTKTDLTEAGKRFDLVFDAVGKLGKQVARTLRKPSGKLVSVSGQANFPLENLQLIRELVETGQLKPVIDRVYPLQDIREAHRYVEQFRKRGNVAVKLVQD